MAVNEVRRRRYKRVAPDGGYGYWILVAASVNLISTTMFYVCFGMIFNDFFKQTGMGTTGITVLTGIRALSMALSGFLTGPLLKMMSRRKLAVIGSVLFNSGVFGTVFVKTQAHFIVFQGFLQIFGVGILYNVSCITINDYFVEKRLLVISIAQTLAATSVMVAPMVVSWSMAEYGYHGTLIVISAVGLHSFAASALLQPVVWHYRKMDAPENGVLLQTDEDNSQSQTPGVSEYATTRNAFTIEQESTNSIWVTMRSYLDWPLIKRYAPTGAFLGAPFAVFADILFIFNLAQALYAFKWNEDQVKWSFSLIAFGDLATRISLIVFSTWFKKLGNRFIYLIGLLISTATRFAMLWTIDYTRTLACLTVLGISRCIIVVMFPLVASEYVTPEEFPTALGLSMGFYGIVSICLGPIIGTIRDATDDYTIMFAILTAIFTMISGGWSIEMYRDWRRKTHAWQGNKII